MRDLHRHRVVALGLVLLALSPGCAWFSKTFGAGDRVVCSAVALDLDERSWHTGDLVRTKGFTACTSEGHDLDIVASRCDNGAIRLDVGTKNQDLSAVGAEFVIQEPDTGARTVSAQLWAALDCGPDGAHVLVGDRVAGRVWITEDRLASGERARIDYALIGTGEHDRAEVSARGAVTFVVP